MKVPAYVWPKDERLPPGCTAGLLCSINELAAVDQADRAERVKKSVAVAVLSLDS